MKGAAMAVARVVSFEGVNKERMDEMNRQMESGEPPVDLPPGELIVLHDAEGEKSLVVFIFETDEDYRKAHEVLDAMPSEDTPGRRTSVSRYDVAARMTP
jgi:hypothetical protein